VSALPAHVLLETYSVLTRLPGGLAVPATVAADVLLERFSGTPLRLADDDRAALPATLARAGVAGGASYDGVVALEAAAHAQPLLTLDERAQHAYRRLGTAFAVIGDLS
jgi:toxin FitB